MQSFFRKNQEQLKKQGYIYPQFPIRYDGIGKNRNGQFLIQKWDNGSENYDKCMKVLHQCANEYSNIILSEEALWNNGVRIGKFAKDLKEAGIILKILVYLRRQDLYMQSQWAQNVKEFMTKDFNTFLSETTAHLDYYEHLSELATIVGKENLLVRIYEKQQFEGEKKNLCSDYLKTVGIMLTEEFVVEDVVKNPSLSGVYLECKRMLNTHKEFATKQNFVVPYFYDAMRANEAIDSYSENKYFTYEQQMDFLGRYEKSNEKVAREFLCREDGVLFRDEIVRKELSDEVYSTQEYMDVMAYVLLMQHKQMEVLKQENRRLRSNSSARIIGAVKRRIKKRFKK